MSGARRGADGEGPGGSRTRVAFRFVCVAFALGVLGCASPTLAPPLAAFAVADGRRIGAGGFPNNGGNPFATTEVTSFTVRHRGTPVAVTHGTTTLTDFWRVVRLPDAPQPTLLASTTDFHLITDHDGALETRSFGEPSTDLAEYQWLDANDGQPAAPAVFGIEKVDREGTELRGGRCLRLASHTVLDVRTLRAFAVRPWIESREGVPLGGLSASGVRALAFSPGQTQYATVGSGNDSDRDGASYEALVVVDIPRGDAYGYRLDRKATHQHGVDRSFVLSESY